MPDRQRIALAGFGNVGKALATLLAEGHPVASDTVIVGVSDPRYGTVISAGGLDARALLEAAEDGGFANLGDPLLSGGVDEMIEGIEADTLVEISFTDLETGEPATTHIRHALSAGWNVSTTNKGPLALHFNELLEMAQVAGVILAFEGTVMSGTPVIELARLIRDANCTGLSGILNGTTNYILHQIERGSGFDEALQKAQRLGYAEAEPRGDIEGHDTAAKLVILSAIVSDSPIRLSDVELVPLNSVSVDEVREARREGSTVRYVGACRAHGDGWQAGVAPRRLSVDDPLAGIVNAGNGVTFHTELLGDLTLFGPGAGPVETAYAVLSDLGRIQRMAGGFGRAGLEATT